MNPREADIVTIIAGAGFLVACVAVDLYLGVGVFQAPKLWVPIGVLTGLAMFVAANKLEESKVEAVEV